MYKKHLNNRLLDYFILLGFCFIKSDHEPDEEPDEDFPIVVALPVPETSPVALFTTTGR